MIDRRHRHPKQCWPVAVDPPIAPAWVCGQKAFDEIVFVVGDAGWKKISISSESYLSLITRNHQNGVALGAVASATYERMRVKIK
jgi:hypothetical protein